MKGWGAPAWTALLVRSWEETQVPPLVVSQRCERRKSPAAVLAGLPVVLRGKQPLCFLLLLAPAAPGGERCLGESFPMARGGDESPTPRSCHGSQGYPHSAQGGNHPAGPPSAGCGEVVIANP